MESAIHKTKRPPVCLLRQKPQGGGEQASEGEERPALGVGREDRGEQAPGEGAKEGALLRRIAERVPGVAEEEASQKSHHIWHNNPRVRNQYPVAAKRRKAVSTLQQRGRPRERS